MMVSNANLELKMENKLRVRYEVQRVNITRAPLDRVHCTHQKEEGQDVTHYIAI